MYIYKVYNYIISCYFEIAFLKPLKEEEIDVDILILPNPEPNIDKIKKHIKDDVINFKVAKLHRKNIAYLEIHEGKKILVNNFAANVDEVSKLILNAAIGYCLYQKKILVMHGCAVSKNEQAYLFLGKSGYGKSSIAANLVMNHGFAFIAEDISAIKFIDGMPYVHNSYPYIKLDSSMAKLTNINKISCPKRVSDRLNRSLYKINSNSNNPLTKVKAAFYLNWDSVCSIKEISGTSRFSVPLISLFTCHPLNSCNTSSRLFMKDIGLFNKSVKTFSFKRPTDDFFKSDKMLLNHINDI